MAVRNLVEATCEGPRCKRGQDGKPMQLVWEPDKAKEDALAIPEEAWKFVTLVNFIGQQHLFCCVRCQHDWQLDNPFTLKSPRELAAQQETSQKVQAEKLAKERAGETPLPTLTKILEQTQIPATEGDPA